MAKFHNEGDFVEGEPVVMLICGMRQVVRELTLRQLDFLQLQLRTLITESLMEPIVRGSAGTALRICQAGEKVIVRAPNTDPTLQGCFWSEDTSNHDQSACRGTRGCSSNFSSRAQLIILTSACAAAVASGNPSRDVVAPISAICCCCCCCCATWCC